MKTLSIIIAVITVAISSISYAADGDWSVKPGLKFLEDSDSLQKGRYSYGPSVGFEYLYGKNATELQLWYNKIDASQTEPDGSQIGAAVNQYYYLSPESSLTSYFVGGAGYTDSDYSLVDNKEFQLSAGLGVRKTISDSTSFFIDVRGVHGSESDSISTGVNLGLTMLFSGGNRQSVSEPARQAARAAPPSDTDFDGVPDARDECPNTSRGVMVNLRGCLQDSDNDGIANSTDRCPDTPAGVAVGANGCRLIADADRDGIADRLDQCPGTAIGIRVNATGCEAKVFQQERLIIDLQFASGSRAIGDTYMPEIEKLAVMMKKYPTLDVLVEGHTDSTGSAEVNQSLSAARAESVKTALVTRFGIAASRISTIGFGPAQPIASNATVQGRAINRRVVAVLDTRVAR